MDFCGDQALTSSKKHLVLRYNNCYTQIMKTAISIPDELFEAAETTAARLGVSRSEFYRKALIAFLEKYDEKLLTKALNEIYSESEDDSELDPSLMNIQVSSLEDENW